MRGINQDDTLQYEPIQTNAREYNESFNSSKEYSSMYEKKMKAYKLSRRQQQKLQKSNKRNLIFPTIIVLLSLAIIFIFVQSRKMRDHQRQFLDKGPIKNSSSSKSQRPDKKYGYAQQAKQKAIIPQQIERQKTKEQKIELQNTKKGSQQKKSVSKDVKKQSKIEAKQKPLNYKNSKSKTQKVLQKDLFSDDYEYDVEGMFSLWDLNPKAKQIIFKRYSALPSNKKLIKGDKYMEINYGKDQQFLNFSKTYEENIEVIDWSSFNLTEDEKANLSNDFQKALQKRRGLMKKLLTIYRNQYFNKKGLLDYIKNITYQRFLQSLQYQLLTGQNLQKNLQIKSIYEKQKEYFRKTYHTDKPKNEIQACVLIPTFNNVVDHRYLWNLESILQQQYNNYRLIIIDDGSNDETSLKIAQHLNWRGVSKDKAVLIRNKKHSTALPNVYYGIHKYCDYNQIFYTIDGDDEIVGTQVFKLFNALYQQKKYYTLYASHFQYESKKQQTPLPIGLPFAYPQQIKKKNGYRVYKHAYSQLRTGMTDVFLLMNIKSLQDQEGELYKVISDNALYFSAMQMSCGRVDYIPELEYWYNANTGINDWYNPDQQAYGKAKIGINTRQKHYQCIHKTITQIQASLRSENTL